MYKFYKHILFIFLSISNLANISAQDDCVLKLNEAQKLYENGKIEQIPSLLNNCIESGFNRENRIQALRLLTLVYLFEDNSVKAEKTLLSLLKIDPEYKVNQAIDPVEFIRLYNSFNTAPLFSLGILGGPSMTVPHLIEPVSPNGFDEANPQYSSSGISVSVGLKAIYHINNIWDLSIEPSFSYLSFQLVESVNTVNTTTVKEVMKYLNFPVFGTYYFYKTKKYDFYGEAGFSYDMFLSGYINGEVTSNNNETPSVEPGEIQTANQRNNYNLAGSIGVGTKVDLNRSNIQVALRYKFGLMNVVNPASRAIENYSGYGSEYRDRDNDFSINNFYIMIGYNWEFFNHKKKPHNQTNYDVIK